MNLKLPFSFRALFIAFCLFSNLFSSGQEGKTKVFSDSTEVDAPKAIPILNLVRQIQIANKELKVLKTKIQPKSEVRKIESLFPTHKEKISLQQKEAEAFIKSNPNKQKITNLLIKINRYNAYLNTWETTISSNIKRNIRYLENISYQEKTWKLTLESLKTQNVPIEIQNNARSKWDDYSEIKKLFLKENNKYLSLESEINYQISATNDLVDQLEKLKASELYNITYRRHAPLWQTNLGSEDIKLPKRNEESGLTFFKNNLDVFKTFDNLFVLISFLILLIIVLYQHLKKGFVLHEIDENNELLKASKQLIFNHTWMVTIFTCLIVIRFYFTNAPQLINNFLIILLLIFATPIVNQNITKRFKSIIYVIILFYIYNSIKTYIWFEPFQYRIYLLTEALLVLISLYYFTKPFEKSKNPQLKEFDPFLIKLTPLIYLLPLASIASNILGYTNLADVTIKICTHGSSITIISYAIFKAAESLSLAIIHRHYGHQETADLVKKAAIEKKLVKTIKIIVFILWLIFFMNILDQSKTMFDFFNDILSEPYIIGTITITIGDVLSFISILISSFLATSFVSFIIDNDQGVLKSFKLAKGVPAAISLVIRYLIIAFGIVFALSSLGIDLSKFNLMAGALGLGIGFGLQNIISNFISGVILVFERPILPGDTIEVNNLLGTVNKIGIRSSNISTFDGADVVVPNSNLISNDLINWTLTNNIKRVEILVGTTYDSDPNQILQILLDCANDHLAVIKNPVPISLFSDFGDSSLNFRLRFWVHFSLGLQAKSDVSIAIYNKFKEHGIEIPFPQQDVFIKNLPDKK